MKRKLLSIGMAGLFLVLSICCIANARVIEKSQTEKVSTDLEIGILNIHKTITVKVLNGFKPVSKAELEYHCGPEDEFTIKYGTTNIFGIHMLPTAHIGPYYIYVKSGNEEYGPYELTSEHRKEGSYDYEIEINLDQSKSKEYSFAFNNIFNWMLERIAIILA